MKGFPKKTRVHLLSHANVDPSAAISAGNYSDAELAAFLSKNICFFLSRTSLEMENIEIYGDDVENCIRAFYLQEKVLKLVNMRFSNTGNSIFTQDPIGMHLENIVVDHSRVYVFLESLGTSCNYPEAFTTNTIYINNITQETSTDVFSYGRTKRA